MPALRKWSDEDLELLRQAYSSWPPDLSLLPHWEKAHVHNKAYKLGISGARLVGPLFEHVSDLEWAYFAGLIDGEGTIRVYDQRRAWVLVGSTHRGVIDWVLEKFPGGGINEYPLRARCKPFWQLRWTRRAVMAEIIRGVWPYLIIKRDDAREAMEVLDPAFLERLTLRSVS